MIHFLFDIECAFGSIHYSVNQKKKKQNKYFNGRSHFCISMIYSKSSPYNVYTTLIPNQHTPPLSFYFSKKMYPLNSHFI